MMVSIGWVVLLWALGTHGVLTLLGNIDMSRTMALWFGFFWPVVAAIAAATQLCDSITGDDKP